ncbi:MAG: hypothetical protein ACI9GB_002964, partial [Halioglobus sp.]
KLGYQAHSSVAENLLNLGARQAYPKNGTILFDLYTIKMSSTKASRCFPADSICSWLWRERN